MTARRLRPRPARTLFSGARARPAPPRPARGRRPAGSGAARRPHCGPGTAAWAPSSPSAGARAPPSGQESPPTAPAEGAAPTRSPQLLPAPAHAGEPLAHRYPRRRRPPPPGPFLAECPWSSFAWLPQKAVPNLARSWGLPGSGTTRLWRGPASGRGRRGASGCRLRGCSGRPARLEAEPKRPPTRALRPRQALATRAGPGH